MRDDEIAREIESHLEAEAEEQHAGGLSAEEAQYAARRAFGNVTRVQEETRAVWIWVWFEQAAQDMRYATRLLVKERWFTLGAVAALALGIAANNAVFTLVNAVLIRSLPFDNPDRVVAVGTRELGRDPIPGPQSYRGVSFPDYLDWRNASSFADLAAYAEATMNVSDDDVAAERYLGTYLSAQTFGVLGQRPALGRDFRQADDRPGASAVVILGHGLWTRRYGADPAVLGRTIRVNGVPSTVVGVMPAGLGFPETADLWQPLMWLPDLTGQARDARRLRVVGRLADDVSVGQARAELDAIAAGLADTYPTTNTGTRARVLPYREQYIAPQIAVILLALMGAVAFVLLIACANVASLLLARSAVRSREIAVRLSLGATRGRVIRQLLVESVLLAVVAGAAGLGLSIFGIRLLGYAIASAQPPPYWIRLTMDGPVFVFLAAVALGTALVFGLVPALHASKTDVQPMLQDGGRTGAGGRRVQRWTGALVAAELALTLMLLAGAGFMMRTFLDMFVRTSTIETSRLLTLRLELPTRPYETSVQRLAFFEQLDERLAANDTIRATTVASHVPLRGGTSRRLMVDDERWPVGEPPPRVAVIVVGARYFETLGLSVRRGRTFTDRDGTPGFETAIINERFATRYVSGGDPIGRRIRLSAEDESGDDGPWLTVVGVVPSVARGRTQGTDAPAMVYLPYRAAPPATAVLIVRLDGEDRAIVSRVREEVRALDADLPLWDVMTVDEWLAFVRWPQRVFGIMFSIFAGIALALSAVGLYAVTAYAVAQRTHEIGVRMVLGAQPWQVRRLVLRRAIRHLSVGLCLGLAGALGVGRILRSNFVSASPSDPAMLGITVAVLVAVAVAACLVPARRAARVDPLVALRYE